MYTNRSFIGQKIREFRKKKKLSQAALAEMVGLSDKHIGRIEAGKYFPNFGNFMSILEALDMNLSEFGSDETKIDNPKRAELIKIMYSVNDEKLEMFYKIIKAILD